jgi:hypothetical protein
MSTARTSSESLDARIAQLAAAQHGAISRVQARQLGATPSAVEVRLLSGRWTQRHRGVYVIGGTPLTWLTELHAAALARPTALVSHEAAGVLLRMRYVPRGIVALVDDRSHQRLEGVLLHRPRRLDRNRSVVIAGLPVTDRASTIVDLSSVLKRGRFTRVLDDQLTSHQIDLPDLIAAFEAQARRGRPGIAMLRQLLEERAGGVAATRSELERLFRDRVVPHIDQTATFEFLPPWRSDGVGRADCAFSTERVLVEVDGRRWHLRDADNEADHARDQEALEHDWLTVRYTYRQITENPASVVANLRKILELRAVGPV